MKLFAVTLITLSCVSTLLALPVKKGTSNSTSYKAMMGRIINGNKAEKGQFPWMAGLFLQGEIYGRFCGGVILSEEWILTAGTCVHLKPRATVQVGSVTLGNPDASRQVSETPIAYAHEDYFAHSKFSENDIGLVHLTNKLELNEFVQPIALDEGADLGVGIKTTVSGYGVLNDDQIGDFTNTLNFAELNTLDTQDCADILEEQDLPQTFVCLQGEKKESTCDGDNGSPVVTTADGNPLLVGIIGFHNYLTCETGTPIGATRINQYRDWIKEQTGI